MIKVYITKELLNFKHVVVWTVGTLHWPAFQVTIQPDITKLCITKIPVWQVPFCYRECTVGHPSLTFLLLDKVTMARDDSTL